jgi:hypothetical protein
MATTSNKIQIKRSQTTATPSGLANGELAWSSASEKIFIGDFGTTVAIGGVQYPGTLTANQALVANSTSGIDKIIVANLVSSYITANNVFNPEAQIGYSDKGYILAVNDDGKTFWKDASKLSVSANYVQNTDSRQLSGNIYFSAANTYIDNLFIGSGYASGNGYGLTSVNAALLGGQSLSQVLNLANAYINTAFANAASRADNAYANSISYTDSTTATAFANAAARAASAYANAISYTDSTTATAFANAAARAASAYSNAVSYVNNYTGFVNKTSDNYVATISGGTGVTVSSGTGNGSTPSVSIGQSVGTTDSVTFATGNFTSIVSNTSIIANNATIYHDLVVGGSILVTGNIVSSNIESIQVSDPLLHLGTNNHVSDTLDIGFFADYYDGVNVQYTGLVRDASDKIYKLFQHLDTDPNPLVNFNETTTATLQAYLISGALTSNNTALNITANNTLHVAFQANTLTLTTPLAYDSGGTGFNSYSQGDLLVGNTTGGAGLSKLGLGTAGYVLMSDGTNLVYSTLDGGTF